MSRVLIATLVLLCLVGGGGTRGQIGPGGLVGLLAAGGGATVTRTFGQATSSASPVSSFSVSMTYGAPAQAGRVVVVGLGMVFASGGSISTVTVGGISASLIDTVSNSLGITQLWSAVVSTGTSGTVAVTAGSGTFTYTVFTESVLNAKSTPTGFNHAATSGASPSVALTEPARSVVTAMGFTTGTGTLPSWSIVSADGTQTFGTVAGSFASAAFATSQSTAVSFTAGGSFNSLVAAVWGPP